MLYALKSLPVVREVYRSDALPPTAVDYRRDTITLGWEDRVRARGRRRSDHGVEFGTALERGTVLRDGDWLLLDGLATAIGVVARAEAVLVIEAPTSAEAALFGYHIGNSHQPVMVTESAIICPDLPGVAALLDYHRIPFARAMRPFTPVGLDVPAHRHQR